MRTIWIRNMEKSPSNFLLIMISNVATVTSLSHESWSALAFSNVEIPTATRVEQHVTAGVPYCTRNNHCICMLEIERLKETLIHDVAYIRLLSLLCFCHELFFLMVSTKEPNIICGARHAVA